MKLKLEPTVFPPREGIPSPTISIAFPDDDMTCGQVIRELMLPVLRASYPQTDLAKFFTPRTLA